MLLLKVCSAGRLPELDLMIKQLTGSTGNPSKLALGTAQFGLDYGVSNRSGKTPPEEALQMIGLARLHGIDTLDTAISYGESERLLGEIGVKDFKIITKLPGYASDYGSVEAWVTKQVEASLVRLRVDRIHGLLLHQPRDILETHFDELVRSLQKIKRDGLVEKIGVSIYRPSELEKLVSYDVTDLISAPYNVIDRRVEQSGWLLRLTSQGSEVHVRSVFLQGLLLMSRLEATALFPRWEGKWRSWEHGLQAFCTSAREACLSLLLRKPEATKVVVGAESLIQLEQLIQISHEPLIEEDFDFMVDDEEKLVNPSWWNRAQ